MLKRNTLIVFLGLISVLLISFLILGYSNNYSKLKFNLTGNTLSFDLDLRDADKLIEEKLGFRAEEINNLALRLSEQSAQRFGFINGKEANVSTTSQKISFVSNLLDSVVGETKALSSAGTETAFLPRSTFLFVKGSPLASVNLGTDLIDKGTPLSLVGFGKERAAFAFIQKSTLTPAQISENGLDQLTKSIRLDGYPEDLILGLVDGYVIAANGQEAYQEFLGESKGVELGKYPESIFLGWLDLQKISKLGLSQISSDTKDYFKIDYQDSVSSFFNNLLKHKEVRFWLLEDKLLRGELLYE